MGAEQSKTAMFLFGNSSPDGTTREGALGEEYAGVPTIRAKRLARQQLAPLAAALSAEPKVYLTHIISYTLSSNVSISSCLNELPICKAYNTYLSINYPLTLIVISIAKQLTSTRPSSIIRSWSYLSSLCFTRLLDLVQG